jgi:hypothetical protein
MVTDEEIAGETSHVFVQLYGAIQSKTLMAAHDSSQSGNARRLLPN